MRKKLLAGAIAASFLLTSCGAPQNQGNAAENIGPVTDLESLVAAAQEEGTLLVYTSLTESDSAAMTEAFTEKYGIEVQLMRLGGTDAATRFDTETSANAPSADLLIMADPTYIGDIIEKGMAADLGESGLFDLIEDAPEHLQAPEIGSAIVQIVNSGVAYNTNLVSAEDAPKSWEDLLDPRWTGKLIGTPPDSSMNNLVVWGKLYDELGIEFIQNMNKQISRTYPNLVPLHEALSAGDGEIALQSAQFFVEAQKAAGKPMEFINLQPSVYPVHALGISNRAANPHAARLLSHFLMTEEGGATISNPEAGSFSAWDEELIPADFEVISPEIRDRYDGLKDEILGAFNG